jgi:hypothetical protein
VGCQVGETAVDAESRSRQEHKIIGTLPMKALL